MFLKKLLLQSDRKKCSLDVPGESASYSYDLRKGARNESEQHTGEISVMTCSCLQSMDFLLFCSSQEVKDVKGTRKRFKGICFHANWGTLLWRQREKGLVSAYQ